MDKSVLYVEDDLVQGTLVKSLLEDDGFFVTHVSNGFDAMEAVHETPFDLILTDHFMPNMSGVELLSELINLGCKTPVVLMTAATDVSLAFSALRLGAADFISKDSDGSYLDIVPHVITRSIEKNELEKKAVDLADQLALEKHICFATLDALSQGVVVLDSDFSIKYFNSHFCQIFGVPLDALKGEGLHTLALICHRFGSLNGSCDVAGAVSQLQYLLSPDVDLIRMESETSLLEVRCTAIQEIGYALTFSDVSHQVEHLNALNRVIKHAPVAMMAVENSGKVVLANNKACEMLGMTLGQLCETSVSRFVPFEHRHGHQKMIDEYFNNLTPRRMREGMDVQLLNNSGKVIPVEISLSGIEMYGKKHVLATVIDISHRKQAERVMRQAHELTQSIIEHSPFSIVATDVEGNIIAVSPALEKMLWYERSELVGKQKATIFHDEQELSARKALLAAELGLSFDSMFDVLVEKARRGVVEGSEWTFVRRDGSKLEVNMTVTILRDQNEIVAGYLMVAYDITDQKRANEYIQHIAHHDSLTGLPNRVLMQDRLQNALHRVKRQGGCLAVLVLDLDHFKRINDTLGHFAGDQLLKTVAERLKLSVRESDTVCRMGGDEFVVLLSDIKEAHDVEAVSKKIIENISKPIKVGQNALNVTPSLGYSISPQHGLSTEELLKNADIAMYHAKHTGRNGYQPFSHELAVESVENLAIEQSLHDAYRNNQLTLHYQPQLDLNTGEVAGFEALIRWKDDARGMVPPSQFIPLTETTGFVTTLGEWVLGKACEDIQTLRKVHNKAYRVAVNVSPRQFEHPKFLGVVSKALKRSGLPPQALELEITEGILVENSNLIVSKLNALSKMGVLLSIDDFGTGYSSLSYVSKYPINTIKIDRSFMAIELKENVAIVGAILAIAEGLGLTVVAEGVETQAQLDFVKEKGCHVVQGFYFSQARPLDQLEPSAFNLNRLSCVCS